MDLESIEFLDKKNTKNLKIRSHILFANAIIQIGNSLLNPFDNVKTIISIISITIATISLVLQIKYLFTNSKKYVFSKLNKILNAISNYVELDDSIRINLISDSSTNNKILVKYSIESPYIGCAYIDLIIGITIDSHQANLQIVQEKEGIQTVDQINFESNLVLLKIFELRFFGILHSIMGTIQENKIKIEKQKLEDKEYELE